MGKAKRVLLLTNSTTPDEIILIKDAITQAEQQGLNISLSLVHVIPNLPTCYFNIPSMVVLAERYYEDAVQSLTSVGAALGIGKKEQWLISGRVKTEVLHLANKLDIDFILAGSAGLQDLHNTFFSIRKMQQVTPIRSIGSLVSL